MNLLGYILLIPVAAKLKASFYGDLSTKAMNAQYIISICLPRQEATCHTSCNVAIRQDDHDDDDRHRQP